MNEDAWASEIERLEELVAGAAGAMAFPLLAELHRRAGRPEAAERVAREGLARSPGVSAGRVALALALLDQKRSEEARAELERLLGSASEHALAGAPLASHAPERLTSAGATGALATLDPYPYEPAPAGRRAPSVFGGEVADGEFDSAFEAARPEREQMLGADDVAHAALVSLPQEDEVDAQLVPESGLELADAGPGPAPARASPFATETVAGLLERQGHRHEAERIRAALSPSAGASEDGASADEAGEASEYGASADEAGEALEHGTPADAGVAAAPEGARHGKRATLERWLDNLRRER